MRFGVREIANVCFRAKKEMSFGGQTYHKNQPVFYIDTAKTSTVEGSSSTVYAQGGRGNAQLVAWDGERTVTFTVEDALISETSLAVLTGASDINTMSADENNLIFVHQTFDLTVNEDGDAVLDYETAKEAHATSIVFENVKGYVGNIAPTYGAILDENGDVLSFVDSNLISVTEGPLDEENYPWNETAERGQLTDEEGNTYDIEKPKELDSLKGGIVDLDGRSHLASVYTLKESGTTQAKGWFYKGIQYGDLDSATAAWEVDGGSVDDKKFLEYKTISGGDASKLVFHIDVTQNPLAKNSTVRFDCYVVKKYGARQITIDAKHFATNFYIEADTLFRDENGKDYPAIMVFPNAKIQSNFNFSMAASGDPSTFTFTMDAFPGYTNFDPKHKVFVAINTISD